MHYHAKTFAAVIGSCAVVTLGAVSARLVEGQAAPSIKGPAALPT